MNKIASCVEARLDLRSCDDWLPNEVRERLCSQQSSRVNRVHELIVRSQEHRSQQRNRAECIAKLESMLERAWAEPKERKFNAGLSAHTKTRRKEARRMRGQVKLRRNVRQDEY